MGNGWPNDASVNVAITCFIRSLTEKLDCRDREITSVFVRIHKSMHAKIADYGRFDEEVTGELAVVPGAVAPLAYIANA